MCPLPTEKLKENKKLMCDLLTQVTLYHKLFNLYVFVKTNNELLGKHAWVVQKVSGFLVLILEEERE